MTLSEQLRNELAALDPRAQCDRLAELSALLRAAGSVHLHGRGGVSVHLDVASPAVARRIFALFRWFGVRCEIRTYRRDALGQGRRYELHVTSDERALQVLHEAGVLAATSAPLSRPPKRIVARSCCRRAYLRGAMLGAGSLSGPRSPHLELRSSSREGAEFLVGVAREEGVRLAIHERSGHAVAYAKGTDAIVGALLAAGATDLALVLEERTVLGATRARANRLANADHANLVRTSRAAQAQLRAVRRLAESGELSALSQPLQEIAELRLAHPSASLRELALRCRPRATKAAAHRRLTRLVRLAEL